MGIRSKQPSDRRSEKGFPVVLPMFRLLAVYTLALMIGTAAEAAPVTVEFSAIIGTSNSIDTEDVFGEGTGANLANQVIVGSVIIDPASLTEVCTGAAACYSDFGAGSISISFTLNGITTSVVSKNIPGSFINLAAGSVSLSDPSHGGSNYLGVAATGPDGMVQESIGALFDDATLFSANGSGDPATAIGSLADIGDGAGLVSGGITLLTPIEHLDATILTIDIPVTAGPVSSRDDVSVSEPGALAVFGVALCGLGVTRRKRAD